MNARTDIEHLLPAWQAFCSSTDIGPVRNKTHYKRMVSLMEALLDQAKGDEAHPAMELVDVVGDFVAQYEAQAAQLPAATGVQALRFLMQQHGVTQAALPEVGSQGVLSEVLSGRRELNLRQVRALAKRFNVSPATFL